MSTSRNDTNLSSVITKDEYYKTFDFYCQGITNVEEEQITHFSKALNCPRHLLVEWFKQKALDQENSNNERNGSSSQVDEIEKIEEKSGFREEILLTMRKSRNLQQNGHQETVEDSRNTELYQPIICKQYFNSLLMISVNAAKYSPQSPSLDLVLSEKNGIKPNQLKPFIQHLSNAKYTIQRIGMLSVIYVTENHAIIQELAGSQFLVATLSLWLSEATREWNISLIMPIIHICQYLPFKWIDVTEHGLDKAIENALVKARMFLEGLLRTTKDEDIQDHRFIVREIFQLISKLPSLAQKYQNNSESEMTQDLQEKIAYEKNGIKQKDITTSSNVEKHENKIDLDLSKESFLSQATLSAITVESTLPVTMDLHTPTTKDITMSTAPIGTTVTASSAPIGLPTVHVDHATLSTGILSCVPTPVPVVPASPTPISPVPTVAAKPLVSPSTQLPIKASIDIETTVKEAAKKANHLALSKEPPQQKPSIQPIVDLQFFKSITEAQKTAPLPASRGITPTNATSKPPKPQFNLDDILGPDPTVGDTRSAGETPSSTRPRKRVRFAEDYRLVEIREYERNPAEWLWNGLHEGVYPTTMDQYSSHSTSSTVTWYTPRYVELPHDYQIPAETLSTEAEYQIQREGGCLAAIYINERHIPPSPTEWSATSPVDPNAFVPIIPLTDCYMSADEVDYV